MPSTETVEPVLEAELTLLFDTFGKLGMSRCLLSISFTPEPCWRASAFRPAGSCARVKMVTMPPSRLSQQRSPHRCTRYKDHITCDISSVPVPWQQSKLRKMLHCMSEHQMESSFPDLARKTAHEQHTWLFGDIWSRNLLCQPLPDWDCPLWVEIVEDWYQSI